MLVNSSYITLCILVQSTFIPNLIQEIIKIFIWVVPQLNVLGTRFNMTGSGHLDTWNQAINMTGSELIFPKIKG